MKISRCLAAAATGTALLALTACDVDQVPWFDLTYDVACPGAANPVPVGGFNGTPTSTVNPDRNVVIWDLSRGDLDGDGLRDAALNFACAPESGLTWRFQVQVHFGASESLAFTRLDVPARAGFAPPIIEEMFVSAGQINMVVVHLDPDEPANTIVDVLVFEWDGTRFVEVPAPTG